jgi:hypothetical protein
MLPPGLFLGAVAECARAVPAQRGNGLERRQSASAINGHIADCMGKKSYFTVESKFIFLLDGI